MSIFRVNGLGYANATQLIAFAGFLALFFFLTLYMQVVLPIPRFRPDWPTCRSVSRSR